MMNITRTSASSSSSSPLPCRSSSLWISLSCSLLLATTRSTVSALIPSIGYKVGTVSAGPPLSSSQQQLQISQLGCGTWSWGNRLLWDYDPKMDDELYQTYKVMRTAGISIFDTADSYGTLELNGRAELLLGQFEKQYLQEEQRIAPGGRVGESARTLTTTIKPFWDFMASSSYRPQQVATKFAPYPWRVTRSSIVQAARQSLQRLDQDKLCIAQLHWSTSNYFPYQEQVLWNGIADVYHAGLCEAVGVSNYGPKQLQKVATKLSNHQDGPVPLAVAQIQFSLMTWNACQDMTDVCQDLDCRLISYSPLCLGLLTGKYNLDNLPRPGNPRRQLFRELLPGAQELLSTLTAMAKEYKKTPSQIAINWAVCKGTVPIPGARTVVMAQENIGSVGWKLRPDAITELDRVAMRVSKPMIQNIFQTK